MVKVFVKWDRIIFLRMGLSMGRLSLMLFRCRWVCGLECRMNCFVMIVRIGRSRKRYQKLISILEMKNSSLVCVGSVWFIFFMNSLSCGIMQIIRKKVVLSMMVVIKVGYISSFLVCEVSLFFYFSDLVRLIRIFGSCLFDLLVWIRLMNI